MLPLLLQASLFYVAPLYHLAFTELSQLVVVDSSDLQWFSDPALLLGQFRGMKGGVLLGVGADLSPHYRIQVDLEKLLWVFFILFWLA